MSDTLSDTSGSEPAISVRDVSFSYHGNHVLQQVSFAVAPRSFVAVVGPNGGGKTTLLNLLLGSLRPDAGSISVFGKTPVEARRDIGFVPQSIAFDPLFPLPVQEVVALGRVATRLFGGFSRQDREAALQALSLVRMENSAHALFSELSGGERQRVLIAQALCAHPQLLLLDEPTANVDQKTEAQLYTLFEKLSREITIVLVSHNLNVVSAHATHLLCVNRSVDMHQLGADEEARLEPLSGTDASTAFVHTLHPDHILFRHV